MNFLHRLQDLARWLKIRIDWRRTPMAFAASGVVAIFAVFAILSALSSTYINVDVKPSKPYAGQQVDGELIVPVFGRADALSLSTPSRSLIHGVLGRIQAESTMAAGNRLAGLLGLAAVFGAMVVLSRHWLARLAFFASTSALSVFWSIRVSAGWDEYFINLKHAFNLAKHLTFSANIHSALEATVDVAPFTAAAVLSRLFHMDVADAGIAVSLMGNVLSIAAAYLLARRFSRGAELPAVSAALLVGIAPLIINVGGTGFMSGLFAGLVLLAAYLCVGARGRKTFAGFVLLGALTLFRTEAILFAALLWAAFCGRFVLHGLRLSGRRALWVRAARIMAWRAVAVFSPFILSVAVRLAIFHEAVPTPVIFKNSNGSPVYLRGGINYLLECLRNFRMDVLLAILGLFIIRHLLSLGARATLFMACLLAFTLAYATGGGDWFPPTWARYVAPLITLTTVVAVTTLYDMAGAAPQRHRVPAFVLLLAALSLVIYGVGPGRNAYRDLATDWKAPANRWQRVDRLAAFGDFLKQTTPQDAVVASPEDATLMYHAQRDMVDLLGIANPQIARTPADPIEPGDLMHRRRNLDVLKKAQPEVVALFEMSYVPDPAFNWRDVVEVQNFLQANSFSSYQTNIAFYRVGSFAYLQSLGYRPIAVLMPNRVFFYWVHVKEMADHLVRLRQLGFLPMATVRESYKYSEAVTDRFYGGLPYVSTVFSTDPPDGAIGSLAVSASDPNWGPDAMPKAYVPPDPPAAGAVYGSWGSSDANMGVMRFAPIALRKEAQILVVPVMRGPVGDRQVLTVRDTSGVILAHPILHLAVEHKWYWLKIDLRHSPMKGSTVTVEIADNGDKWGEWSAIGTPRAAPLPIGARN